MKKNLSRCRLPAGQCLLLWLVCLGATPPCVAELPFPLNARRVLFLGDSITNDGRYVAWIETQLRLQGVEPLPELINLGLSSETCSGLSEADHAYPRPDVHERLDRALTKIRPDVVISCYGMNDGIYYPFGQERFEAYQNGVNRLIEKVHGAGAKLILLTPPPFDPLPLRGKGRLKKAGEEAYSYSAMYEGYDDVLARYSRWILAQSDRVEGIVDVRTPLVEYVARERKRDPQFTLSPDGVHPNAEGHRLLGETILRAWQVVSTTPPGDDLLELASKRASLLHYAWLSEVGHRRPGVQPGLPLEEAREQARQLENQIRPLVAKRQESTYADRSSGRGTVYQLHYPGMLRAGELRLSVDYMLWLPRDVTHLRGVIVHQHGCGHGASLGGRTAADDLHWQALARKWDCALMGSSYDPRDGINCRLWCDPRHGSGDRFLQALSDFAELTRHAELKHVPWCVWGHSGGGFWASLMQAEFPERIVAVWLRSGTAYHTWTNGEIEAPTLREAVYRVPVMANPGLREKDHERFHRTWDGLVAMQKAYRERGAFFEFAPDPRTAHECGDSRYLAIPFFDFWLKHRLAHGQDPSQTLRPAAQARALWKKSMTDKVSEYIGTGAVSDDTPPPSPLTVTAIRNSEKGVTVTWMADADLESGIRCFVIERDGERIGQVPEAPQGRFGRPLFQGMSYHDTPAEPLPEMRFVDVNGSTPAGTRYAVKSVNSVGLVSEPTTSQALRTTQH